MLQRFLEFLRDELFLQVALGVTPVRIQYGNGVTPSATCKTSKNRCYIP